YGIPLPDTDRAQVLANEEPPEYDYQGIALIKWWKWRWKAGGPLFNAELATARTAEMLLSGLGRPLAHRAAGRAAPARLPPSLQVPTLALAGSNEMLYRETMAAPSMNPVVRFQ